MTVQPLLVLLSVLVVVAVLVWLAWSDAGQRLRRRWRPREHRERDLREDALKHIHRCERHGGHVTPESLAGALGLAPEATPPILSELVDLGLIALDGDRFRLTDAGRVEAVRVLRAHRLWERYLADRTGFDSREWHDRAEQLEHQLSPEEVEALAQQLGNPSHDPHGDPIPTAGGELGGHGGVPLTRLPAGSVARVVHVEDEPASVFAHLASLDLHPGLTIRVGSASDREIKLQVGNAELHLTPIMAANISVVPLRQAEVPEAEPGERLSALELGETAEVLGLTAACRGNERRRFLDLGLLPGTRVTAELRSPGGDPTAYRVREALIALRRDQADRIRVRRLSPEATASVASSRSGDVS